MTKEQILKKAIEKAEKNGYVPKIQYKANPMLYMSAIIFSHDFAKAFWGKTMVCNIPGCGDEDCYKTSDIYPEGGIEFWKFNLREMVLEKEHIKYLEKFLLVKNGKN